MQDVLYKIRNKRGDFRDISFEGCIGYNPDGSFRQTYCVFQDITERMQAEVMALESNRTLQHLIRCLPSGVTVHEADTHITLANEQASELLGLTIEQMMGKKTIDPAWCFIHEDETPMSVEEYPVARVFATRNPVRNMVLGVIRPITNDRVWVLVNALTLVQDL